MPRPACLPMARRADALGSSWRGRARRAGRTRARVRGKTGHPRSRLARRDRRGKQSRHPDLGHPTGPGPGPGRRPLDRDAVAPRRPFRRPRHADRARCIEPAPAGARGATRPAGVGTPPSGVPARAAACGAGPRTGARPCRGRQDGAPLRWPGGGIAWRRAGRGLRLRADRQRAGPCRAGGAGDPARVGDMGRRCRGGDRRRPPPAAPGAGALRDRRARPGGAALQHRGTGDARAPRHDGGQLGGAAVPAAPLCARASRRSQRPGHWLLLSREPVSAAPTPFVGRSAELAKLVEASALAAQGQAQVVGVVGEAGVGKSRLAREPAAQLQA